jgi:hypothetical protein
MKMQNLKEYLESSKMSQSVKDNKAQKWQKSLSKSRKKL